MDRPDKLRHKKFPKTSERLYPRWQTDDQTVRELHSTLKLQQFFFSCCAKCWQPSRLGICDAVEQLYSTFTAGFNDSVIKME